MKRGAAKHGSRDVAETNNGIAPAAVRVLMRGQPLDATGNKRIERAAHAGCFPHESESTDGEGGLVGIFQTADINMIHQSANSLLPASNLQFIQCIHQLIQIILRFLRFVGLALGDAYSQADRLPAVSDQFAVALLSGDGQRVAAAEELAQVDLQAADVTDRSAGDGRRLVIREHDGVFGTNAAARRTASLAIILVLDDQAIQLVHAVDAEQTEIEAFHAIGTSTVVDHRIPAPPRLLHQLLGGELRLRLSRLLFAEIPT